MWAFIGKLYQIGVGKTVFVQYRDRIGGKSLDRDDTSWLRNGASLGWLIDLLALLGRLRYCKVCLVKNKKHFYVRPSICLSFRVLGDDTNRAGGGGD